MKRGQGLFLSFSLFAFPHCLLAQGQIRENVPRYPDIDLDRHADVPNIVVDLKEWAKSQSNPPIEAKAVGLSKDCSDLYEAICEGAPKDSHAIENENEEIVQQMMVEHKSLRIAARKKDFRGFHKELDSLMRQDLQERGIHVEWVFDSIMLSLMRAVEAQPRGKDPATVQILAQMRESINGARVGTIKNLSVLDDGGLLFCGSNGLTPGAWQGSSLGGNWAWICPGVMLQAYARSKNADDFDSYLHLVVAHELGHGIGPNHSPYGTHEFDRMYENLEASLFRGHQGVGSIDEWAPDFWAAESIALKAEQEHWSQAVVLDTLRKNCHFLCETSGGDSHGNGRDRIEIGLARNARMRRALKCPALPKGEAGVLIPNDE